MSGTALVTGATGGIGYFAAEQLAAAGHHVVLAGRNPDRLDRAAAAVRRHVPGARLSLVRVDLADLASVASAAAAIAEGRPLGALVANAAQVSYGLRPEPTRSTVDGHELHLGTAHLGHYALVARLWPQLEQWGTRLVHVGSISHRLALRRPEPFAPALDPGAAEPSLLSYARSKLAVTLFGLVLADGLAAAGSSVSSVVAHPGVSVDRLTPPRDGIPPSQPMGETVGAVVTVRLGARLMHGKDAGARVLVHAATSPQVRNGEVWGPSGRGRLNGEATRLRPHPRLRDPHLVHELLGLSRRLTGLDLPLLGPRAGDHPGRDTARGDMA